MLGKENTGEQVADNQSRLIRMQKEDTLLSSSQQILKLPEGFTIGKAIGRGDCFFDAVAQTLRQLKPNMEFTIRSLRQLCRELALSDQQLRKQVIQDARNCGDSKIVLPQPGINDDELWGAYLDNILYTAEDMREMKDTNPELHKRLIHSKYGSTLNVPIWGRPDIEGEMICSKYKVKLHVIENLPCAGWSDQLVSGVLFKSVDYVDYSEENTIHIINRRNNHFEPILRKQILPHFYGTVASGKKSNSESVCFQQNSEVEIKDVTDNQMDCEDYKESSPGVEMLPTESTIEAMVGCEYRSSDEEFQYKQSQGNLISSRVVSSSSASKDISDSVWYSALTDCRVTVDDISLTGDEIEERATLFVKTFVRELEEKLSQCSEEAKPNSKIKKTGKVLDQVGSTVKSTLPPGMRVIPDKSIETVGYLFAKEHRKAAKKVSAAATSLKNETRKVLVDAGLEIFQSFESQFTKIVDNDQLSWERGIEKLAIDAVSRVINYISNNKSGNKEKISLDLIEKGIVLGKSKDGTFAKQVLQGLTNLFNSKKLYSGYQVKNKQSGKVWVTSELYARIGIVKKDGDSAGYHQLRENSCAEEYGYRLPFPWELKNWEEVSKEYKLVNPSEEEYVCGLDGKKKKRLASSILNKIDVEGFAQKKDIEDIRGDLRRQQEDRRQFSYTFGKIPEHFIERGEIIKKLDLKLHGSSQELEMSRIVLISGESGVGKSELARGYGFTGRRRNAWTKIMWIDASSYANLFDSFYKLAERLEISVRNEKGQKRRIESIVREVYRYLQDTKSFFVFDNASGYKDIERFLPSHFSDVFYNREKPFILITSKEDWEKERVEEIKLSNFSQEESDSFLRKVLKENESQDDISKLGKILNNHPLNLARVAADINQKRISISEYLKSRYEEIEKSNLGHLVQLDINKELFLTVESKLEEVKDMGHRSYDILSFMAYLDPNRINTEEIFYQKESEEDKQEVLCVIDLLKKSSLIEVDESIVRIHEKIQKIMRLVIGRDGEEEILKKVIILLVNTVITKESHIISFWRYASKYQGLVDEFINLTYYKGATILHLLAKGGNEEIMRLILEKIGQDKLSKIVNATDAIGLTPLHCAISHDHLKVVKYLVKKEANPTISEYGIHYAAIYDALEVVEYFIDEGCFELDQLDEHGRVPLGCAIKYDQLRMVKYLIGKGASMDSLEDEEIMDLFYYASMSGNLDIAQCIVEKLKGANLCDESDKSILHYAAMYGSLDIVEYLVKNGAVVDLYDESDMTPLHYAVTSDDLDVVECLVKNDANVDSRDESGMSPLHHAVISGNLDVIKCLVKNDASVNLYDGSNMSPLHYAIKNDRLDIIEYLVENDACVGSLNENIISPLHYAVKNDRLDAVKCFTRAKVNIDLQDKKGRSPLHYAVKNGCLDIIECLTMGGASVDLQDKKERSPLHYAIKNDCLDVARHLLKVGANIDLIDKDGYNPLCFTSFNVIIAIFLYSSQQAIGCDLYFLNLDNVQYLVESVINVDQFDKYGKSLLHYAAIDGCLDIIKYLKKKGADVILLDDNGMTPLHYAAANGHVNVIECLIGEEADVDLYDKYSMTPLHYAATNGYLTTVEFLVEKGADINSYGKDGNNMGPLCCAATEGYLDIVEYLVKKGADVESRNGNGNSPLDYAIKGAHSDVIEYLKASMKKRPRASELQDCTSPCSMESQCTSIKRKKSEILPDSEELTKLTLDGLIEPSYQINHQIQKLTQLENTSLRKSQRPMPSLNSITVVPADNQSLREATSAGRVTWFHLRRDAVL